MNYCCAKCGALTKNQDLKSDIVPGSNEKRWLCKKCKDEVDALRKQLGER